MAQVVRAVETPPFPIETSAVDRLRLALAVALRQNKRTLETLRTSIEECTRHFRDQGMTPEATLVTMKAFILHTAIASQSPDRAVRWLSEPLMERMVTWCINEYFHVN